MARLARARPRRSKQKQTLAAGKSQESELREGELGKINPRARRAWWYFVKVPLPLFVERHSRKIHTHTHTDPVCLTDPDRSRTRVTDLNEMERE